MESLKSSDNLTKKIFLFLAFVAIVGIALNLNTFPKKSKRDIRFTWPSEVIEHLVLGYHFVTADMFWLRFIQDIDYKEKDVPQIRLGWGYRMAEAITNLDHRFRIVYIAAGTILSVGVGDAEGAKLLMEKGVRYYPQDWSLLYKLAYHYMYELKNCEKAAYYLNEAGKYGAPRWVGALAARLYTHAAQYELAYRVIEENLERFKGTDMEPSLLQRKADIEKAMHGQDFRRDKADRFAEALCH